MCDGCGGPCEAIADTLPGGYSRILHIKNASLLSGKWEGYLEVGAENPYIAWDCPTIQAFLADEDLTRMSVISYSSGFSKTLSKQYPTRLLQE